MPTRQLIEDNGRVRRYRILDDANQEIGTDEETVRTPGQVNETTMRNRVAVALTANATYLALATPTNAQTTAQVQRLTRECSALIRLLVGLLDTTDGT